MNTAIAGYAASFTTVISWTIGSIWFTRASRATNPASVNRVRLLLAFGLLGILVCIFNGITPLALFTSVSLSGYFWFGLSGLVGLSIGDFYTFNAFRTLGPRRTTLFNCFAPAAALITGIFLVNEQIGLTGILGMAISISGILILTLSRAEQHQVATDGYGTFWSGVFAGVMSALCQGIGLVLAKKGFMAMGEDAISPIHATWVRMFTATMFSYAIGIFKGNMITEFNGIAFNKTLLKPVLIGTLFGPVIGVSLSLFAAKSIPVSIAQTILSMVPLSVMITGVLFYKEKVSWQGYLALTISMIGVLMLTLL